jgi:hypothetical protein
MESYFKVVQEKISRTKASDLTTMTLMKVNTIRRRNDEFSVYNLIDQAIICFQVIELLVK